MSQIVSSAPVTLEAEHSQLSSAILTDEHWRGPLWWDGARRQARKWKVGFRSESDLPPSFTDGTKEEKYSWIV